MAILMVLSLREIVGRFGEVILLILSQVGLVWLLSVVSARRIRVLQTLLGPVRVLVFPIPVLLLFLKGILLSFLSVRNFLLRFLILLLSRWAL